MLNLDNERQRQTVAADPDAALRRTHPVFVDEWQKVPGIWDAVRRAVDADSAGGRFLLAGSATPLQGATAHSGAGRIGRLRLRPMTLTERGFVPTVSVAQLLRGGATVLGNTSTGLEQYAREIVATGFPAIRGLPRAVHRFQLNSYLQNIVDRDVPEAGLTVRKPESFLNWLRAYAAASATTANYSQILDAATPAETDKPARKTSVAYRDILLRLWLLDPVPGLATDGQHIEAAPVGSQTPPGGSGPSRTAPGPWPGCPP